MDVEIQASLPKLKKQGRLHALRRISALGRITYEMLRFEGDGTVKNQVIARYLTAEAEAQAEAQKDQAPSLAVTPANYKFKYKGRSQLEGRDVYIFQVTPRQKRQGLFKGDLWIDAAHLPARAGIRVSGKESFHFPEESGIRKKVRDSGRNFGAPASAERSGYPAGGQGGADHRLQQFLD